MDAAEKRYHEKISSLSSREYEVSDREMTVSVRENNVNTEINTKAEKLVRDKIICLDMQYRNNKQALVRQYENTNSRILQQHKDRMSELNTKYQAMVEGYRGMVYFTLFYSILTTIITALKTEAFFEDVVEFIMGIKDVVIIIDEWILVVATFVARLGDMIPQEIVSRIVHWVLFIGIYCVIIGVIGGCVCILGRKYLVFFREKQNDEISVFAGLITLAIVVFASDIIKSILSINLIWLMIFVFMGYTIVRGIIQAENDDVKKNILKCVGLMGGCIATMVVIGHFFGAIGLIAVPIGIMLAICDG